MGGPLTIEELAVPTVLDAPGGAEFATIVHQCNEIVGQGIGGALFDHLDRLGMIVKIANLRALQAYSPESPCILTNNAEENRHMLDVNEAIGFTPIACAGVWKKSLA